VESGAVRPGAVVSREMCYPAGRGQADILLVNIPQRDYRLSPRLNTERVLPPVGLAYLATYLEHMGKRASILDGEFFGLSCPEIIDGAISFGAHAVGLNCYSPTAPLTYSVANELISRGLRVIVGGVHATYCMDEVRRHCPGAEILAGYAEESLYQALVGKVPTPGLDPLSMWLSRSHLAADPQQKRGHLTSCLLSSRGCPYTCTFCTSAQTSYRLRCVEDFVAEMSRLTTDSGVGHFQFLDDLFLTNPKRTEEFKRVRATSAASNTTWQGLATVRTLSMHVAQGAVGLLAESGCRQLSLGFESGSERIRTLAGKTYDETMAVACVRACRENGIRTKGFFMIGFPGETRSEIDQTVQFVSLLKANGLTDLSLFQVKLYPGTALRDFAARYFGETMVDEYYEYDLRSTTSPTAAMRAFSRENYGNKRQLSELPPAELERLIQRVTTSFYSH
jgi:anaerobic magnesium-protoporphyrin IX monomethyl ester cyclase